MRFTIDEDAAVAPGAALAAYGHPAFYEGRAPRDNISVVEVVTHSDDGDRILMEVRFRFSGPLSSAVRAVIDPNKMTWITRTEISVPQRVSNWQVLPDHYPDRLKGSGTYTFKDGSDGPDSSVVTLAGELKVRVPLVGGTVERVIVNGLKSYFSAEVQGLPEVAPG